ncbi:D-2-hydroxyacid dehydrogenase [Methylobacterium nodulans]|uniref:D-isomer specific 2-hydroxyacid dehydrogenase NAD-binding n=1 Tax=Methylobacterium nodulans (strain LMG 21967 / CNCM I-2342 / ORS 2060) TaxID=460265 RepID=B8IK68_METNO|nr:D-2-hydroxyacid dehydrogenase [Methylobacterium nodulans]ACL61853.1 D-isomer specific 2-hydroxyacid dehydrogenase NAD-binding [Methylobacterium nodulans ORS 2060]
MPHTIVFLDRETLDAHVREFSFPHTYKEYDVTAPDQIVERLRDAEIAIVNKVPLRADSLRQLPKLKLIAVAATGTDIVDKAVAKQQGITVVNIRNYAFNTVPEHVIALIFALRRAIVPYANSTRRGDWNKSRQFCYFDYPIRDIAGSTLGIVGYGALGKSIAKRAEALGMTVIAYDVFPQEGLVDFETILRESDVITLHAPLTPETRNMIGRAELAKMKRDAILINTARGGLVDEAALAEALQNGTIAGAGFDVLTTEPPVNGNILLDLDLPNLIVTPHVAWASKEAMQILSDQLVDNIEAFVAGKPQNVVE